MGRLPLRIMVTWEMMQIRLSPAAVPVPLHDMVLLPSFDSDNPVYRYRFLEPASQFIASPVLDTHGWEHDCGYDGVNLQQSLAIAGQFPGAVAVQITRVKKEFNIHFDSSLAIKHGQNGSTMAGFDIQNVGKQLAYIVHGERKFKNFRNNKTAAGFSCHVSGGKCDHLAQGRGPDSPQEEPGAVRKCQGCSITGRHGIWYRHGGVSQGSGLSDESGLVVPGPVAGEVEGGPHSGGKP